MEAFLVSREQAFSASEAVKHKNCFGFSIFMFSPIEQLYAAQKKSVISVIWGK